LTLTERAVRLADRAGLRPIVISGGDALTAMGGPQDIADVLIVGPDTLFDPALPAGLMAAAGSTGTPMAVLEGGSPRLLYVPAIASSLLSHGRSVDSMAAALTAHGDTRTFTGPNVFCRRIESPGGVAAAERDYIRHLNGRHESYFTKQIRRFSVPLSRHLVHLRATPAEVTLTGLLAAALSAWCLAQGSYGLGLVGALLYYISMIFDCSDGEVARLTLRDSPSGAWLETIVDYGTYFLLLAALVTAVRSRPDAGPFLVAASVALSTSLVVVGVASYLRHRVAAADPGQFDDASATAMADAPPLHRFARWGRQWIKRSTIAHLVVGLAIVNQLPILLYLWAFGATTAAIVILTVMPFVVRRVSVVPVAARRDEAFKERGEEGCQ
jgi:phosphatidylglycerophosphate synthase